MAIFADVTENKCINKRHPMVKGDNLTVTARQLENGTRGCKLVLFTNRKSHRAYGFSIGTNITVLE